MSLLDGPGTGFGDENGDGSLPDDSSPLANLSANFNPSLDNLLPSDTASSSMPDSLASFFDNGGDGAYPGATTATIANSASGYSGSLTNFLGNAGTSLLNAFVVNPQNEATAASAATTQAELSAYSTSQIFSYLLIGVVIFAIFGALGKK